MTSMYAIRVEEKEQHVTSIIISDAYHSKTDKFHHHMLQIKSKPLIPGLLCSIVRINNSCVPHY